MAERLGLAVIPGIGWRATRRSPSKPRRQASMRSSRPRSQALATTLDAGDGVAGITVPEPDYPPLSTREIQTLPKALATS